MVITQSPEIVSQRPPVSCEDTLTGIAGLQPDDLATAGLVVYLMAMPERRATPAQLKEVVRRLEPDRGENGLSAIISRLHRPNAVPGVSLQWSSHGFSLTTHRGRLSPDVPGALLDIYPKLAGIVPSAEDIEEVLLTNKVIPREPTHIDYVRRVFEDFAGRLVYFRSDDPILDYEGMRLFPSRLRPAALVVARKMAIKEPGSIFRFSPPTKAAVGRYYYLRRDGAASTFTAGELYELPDMYGNTLLVEAVNSM